MLAAGFGGAVVGVRAGVVERAASETIEEFKRRTLDKLHDVRCPDHKQAPRLNFRGATLRDVSIQMSACCEKLAELANQKIAEPAKTITPDVGPPILAAAGFEPARR
jgi:hypothetical protein